MKRLWNKEIPFLVEKYKNIQIENEDKYILIIVLVDNISINIKVEKILYPFRSPKVKINNYDYIYIISTCNTKYITKLFGHMCLCCKSILCSNNWAPIYNLEKIIIKIRKNLNLKKKIVEMMHCDKIKDKYLISDISLYKYL